MAEHASPIQTEDEYVESVRKRDPGIADVMADALNHRSRAELQGDVEDLRRELAAANTRADCAEAEVEKLRAALRPFADIANENESVGREYDDEDRIWINQAYGCRLAELRDEDFCRVREALSGGHQDGQ